jgi:branched-chain amino acid transport system substrate-binding protein
MTGRVALIALSVIAVPASRHWSGRRGSRRTTRSSLRIRMGLVATACLVFSACGSSSKSSTSTTLPAGSSNTSGTSGTAYAVGVISSDSGSFGANTDNPTTVHDWVNYTNSHGGINGHPVKLYYFNDGDNAATALQDAQALIQNDHVLAIMDGSFVDSAFEKYVDQAKVPVLSLDGSAISYLFVTDSNFFANSATDSIVTYSAAYAAKYAGASGMAYIYCAEDPGCVQSVPVIKVDGSAVGIKIPYTAEISVSAPNYTAQCLAAKSSGAGALFVVTASPVEIERVAANCAQQGYTPIEITAGGSVPDNASTLPGFDHIVGSTNTFPPFLDSTPAMKLFHQVMGSYLAHAQRSDEVGAVWTGMELFAAASANASTSPTPQSIYNGLYALNGSTLGGLAPPLTFKTGQANPINCFYLVETIHGQATAPKGDTPVCATPPAP